MRFGTTELIIILVVVVLIFGPTQLPKLTKMFGKSVKNFKDALSEEEAASEKTENARSDEDEG